MKKNLFILPLLLLLVFPNLSHYKIEEVAISNIEIPLFDEADLENSWIDSIMSSLTLDEKIAQLLMIRVHSDKDETYYNNISDLIKRYNIGGVCFFKGSPVKQAELTNRFQSEAKTPILMAIDGEWGLSMRLDSTVVFPRQMTLGAIQNDRLIYEMGVEIGRQLKRIGLHMNFAPVLDINSKRSNPVINTRSFGEHKSNVARKGLAYMRGMQDKGIIAVGKHFPGHGDTDTDSHFALPVINHSREQLDTLDLFPFKILINNGLQAIMVAHLNIPAYIQSSNLASTLSDSIVSYLLKDYLNFKGLVITDALDMQGVSDHFKPGTIELMALKAGNDILLLPNDPDKAINEIKKAILNNEIDENLINERCRKVLAYKYKVGLNNYQHVDLENLINDLNPVYAEELKRKLFENATTLLKNDNNIIPLSTQNNLKMASLAIGDAVNKPFQTELSKYYNVTHFAVSKDISNADINVLNNRLKEYDLIFVSLHNTSSLPQRQFGVTTQSIKLINTLKRENPIILSIFGVPYILSFFDDFQNIPALFIAYQDETYAQETVARIIKGDLDALGKLPVTGSDTFLLNDGIFTGKYKYLQYAPPNQFGISDSDITKIDSIALMGVIKGAYPGCQVLFAKDGKVFYHKSFGFHTYDSLRPVKNSDLYDIASVTKIVATTLALMKLYDMGKFELQDRLDKYLPYLEGTDKGSIKIIDVLGHQARFSSWIPFYTATLTNGEPNPEIYSTTFSRDFPFKVADKLYMKGTYYDTIISTIVASPLNRNTDYLYSDLGMYFMREIIEKLSGKSIEDFVYDYLYNPMSLFSTKYNPLNYFSPDVIIPSEIDNYFRKQTIHGYVNDQGAAMTGGVSAHAGVFSNSWELAVIMQMLLNEGRLGDKQIINASTVREFTGRHFTSNNNRRGLGFDKPLIIPNTGGPTCIDASPLSYGHTGFTGTYVWADPAYNLVYIFLSNRTYPNPENRLISLLNIRTDIHQVVYDALKRENANNPNRN
ncbi:MAG: glycoside hydrolase family 3 N-terminal domain-containing protein [Bacteroidales bacterium]|nr:glycoside hydrolase family 3 N-terminal domain-containing protein [Bacteroidales bacterium]